MTDEEIKAIAASNARAIEALTESIRELRAGVAESQQEYQRDRAQLYSLMADYTSYQSCIYRVLENLDRRQGEIVDILRLVTQRLNDINE